MDELVTIQIDGKEINVPKGLNLIEAAELAGIHIPNLCYLKGLKGVGACRLCLVEIEGLKAPVIACNTKVKNGMIIHSKTDKIQEIRKFVIDLLLSMHPLDCMTCTKAGVCNLQQYAYDFGLKESSFTRKKFGYPTDEANPFIKRDPEYCILCGRCVRTCKEQGTNVLEFMGRGIESKVITANDKPLNESGCTFCGSCVDACPVNALLESGRGQRGREWEYEKQKSVCLFCGNSCDITISIKDGKVQKINSGSEQGLAEKYLCAYGRFGFDWIEAHSRILTPMMRIDGELKETTWEKALKVVSEKLRKAGKNAGFISTANITNEDAISLKRFAKNVVKTKNFDTTIGLYADVKTLINSQKADINKADLIVLIGLNPSQWERTLPALDASIRKRVQRGAKLIVINSSDTKISEIASINLQGNEGSILKGIAKVLIEKGLKAGKTLLTAVNDARVTEDIEKAATLIVEAKEPLFFASPPLFEASANIAMIKGTIVAVGLESNAKGVALAGLKTEGKSYREMIGNGTQVLYTVGEVPVSKRPHTDFLIVQSSHLTELAQQADIVLPSTVYFEAGGTIVDYMGRLKHLPKLIEPLGESKNNTDIFIALAKIMKSNLRKPTEAEMSKLTKLKPKLSVSPFTKKDGFDISAREFIESVNGSLIHSSRLMWLKETEQAIAV